MFGIGIPEIVLIALAVGILFFGGSKIVDLSRSLGRASGEFKKGKMEIERELKGEEKGNEEKETAAEEPPADVKPHE